MLDEPDAPSQEMVLTRQSLKDTLDEAFFTNVLAWNELQEPTFNELVVIYRMMPDPTTKVSTDPLICFKVPFLVTPDTFH